MLVDFREIAPVTYSRPEYDTRNEDFEGLRHSAKRRRVALEDDEDVDDDKADGDGLGDAADDILEG